ncbi:NADH-quinone oxidoreductase subunit D [candidate division KSB1 bacterium]|nr:NADH-quinone oxidoreductase subunit D [candidate division KSB1 bacterium]MBL7095415.1 NADH-quinone oxidoreductase subunit D [candidate division KSB1 bacterium]
MAEIEIPAKYKVEEVLKRKEILELTIAGPTDEPMRINLGPSHPAMHGTIKMIAELVGETIVNLDIEPGFLHRGMEKMCEVHNYNSALPYTDRLNYVTAFINNFGYAATIEKLFGIEITERTSWLRTLFSELSRITDHYTCQAAICSEIGAMTPFLYLMQARDYIWEHFNWATGARQTYSYSRIGGLAKDVSREWLDKAKEILLDNIPLLHDVHGLIDKNRIFLDRTQGVGEISKEDAINAGITGPFLRSTGCDYDVRKAMPYFKYDEVEWEVPVGKYGDNYDRWYIRMREIEESFKICLQCIEKIPEGPVNSDDYMAHLPEKAEVYGSIEGLINHFKIVIDGPKPPKGNIYHCVEGANGELGYYVVSDGTGTAYRLHVRAPSFLIMGALDKIIIGHQLADIIPIFGSVNMVGGECDR